MAFCYTCYEERETRLEEREHSVAVRGEKLSVKNIVPVCSVCGEEVSTPEAENAILLSAYEEYRRRHGLLSPQDIASIRQRYGLSLSTGRCTVTLAKQRPRGHPRGRSRASAERRRQLTPPPYCAPR